jgi:hypothetical protein
MAAIYHSTFLSYDANGKCLGETSDINDAVRAIPGAKEIEPAAHLGFRVLGQHGEHAGNIGKRWNKKHATRDA